MHTVLVVEDTLTEREIFASCLRRGGLNVLTANNAEEALEKIITYKPDIILLDIVLPGRSGFELCRDLKANTETSKIPVVMCSTKGTDLDKFWGMKQGADAYMPKPVDQEELLRTVKQLIRS